MKAQKGQKGGAIDHPVQIYLLASVALLVVPFAALRRASSNWRSNSATVGTAEDAAAFLNEAEAEIFEAWKTAEYANWDMQTNITDETEQRAAETDRPRTLLVERCHTFSVPVVVLQLHNTRNALTKI